MTIRTMGMVAGAWLLAIGMAGATPAPDSKRMERAKDFIADEQWIRAIVELQAAADDPKEPNRDEALFWLAHSEHQAGDDSSALQTIAKLERVAPTSRWVRLGRSLRIEIAQILRRDDVLWWMVAPPQPPVPTTPPAPASPRAAPAYPAAPPRPVAASTPPAPPAIAPAVLPAPVTPAPPAAAPITPPPPPAPRFVRPARTPGPAPAAPVPPAAWVSGFWVSETPGPTDVTLKVQALTGLLDGHSDQVIPLLREIALDRNSPDEARQAVFVLGQSRRPEAWRTMLEVAHDGAEPVRIAAVRELGRFDGPTVNTELMRVYSMSATPRLKHQVVSSLGERADNVSLLRIVRAEAEPTLRNYAIVTLGRTGARDQLRMLYAQAPADSRSTVLTALFAVKDDDELIRIARTEHDQALRLRARQQLRMLATPKALKYLEENP